MKENYDEPVFLISVVAKMLEIHPQTLRQYEREGLVAPSRTSGKMRLYSKKDLERIKSIMSLTRDMGVNLAGVDIILRLQDKINEYENIIAKFEQNSKKHSLVKKSSFDLVFVEKKR